MMILNIECGNIFIFYLVRFEDAMRCAVQGLKPAFNLDMTAAWLGTADKVKMRTTIELMLCYKMFCILLYNSFINIYHYLYEWIDSRILT